MNYQCEHSDTGLCKTCFEKEARRCGCGVIMNTEHDDRKFEVDGKEVCVECFTKGYKEMNDGTK